MDRQGAMSDEMIDMAEKVLPTNERPLEKFPMGKYFWVFVYPDEGIRN